MTRWTGLPQRSGDIAVGLCFAAVGIAFMAGAVALSVGLPTEPKPGFFPFVDGAILAALSGLLLVQVWRGRVDPRPAFGNIARPAAVVATLVLYVATLEPVGYVLTTTVLCGVVLYVLDTRMRMLIPVSVGLAVASYLLFSRLLGVMLPSGLLTFL